MATKVAKVRELFIEELSQIQAGSSSSSGPCCTTMACCEEGPFGCCETIPNLDDIIKPTP